MLRLYISYSPADKSYLDKLLKWLKPLEERYALQLWYADPDKASPFLYHRYHAPGPVMIYPADWEISLDRLERAHIYLFLMSYNALSTPYIEQEEVPRAVERYIKYSEHLVRIFPVLLSPSLWKDYSRLSGFTALGWPEDSPEAKKKALAAGQKTPEVKVLSLAETQPEEDGFLRLTKHLQIVLEEMHRNWTEEKHRLKPGDEDDALPELQPAAPAQLKPIPGWAGAALLMAVFYLVTSIYLRSCAPRMYHGYVPESLPYQPMPEQYWRENPVTEPEEVPLRPVEEGGGM